MFARPLVLIALAAGLLAPSASFADKWYQSPWFWGPAGLVTGGVVGYAIGRDSRPSHGHHYNHYPSQGYAQPIYHGGPISTGATHVDETRVWPFYRRTRIYPIASHAPVTFTPQSVSMTEFYRERGERYVNTEAEAEKPVSVSIGDNNQNVSITVNVDKDGRTSTYSNAEKENILNYKPNAKNGRLVDRAVRMPVGAETAQSIDTGLPADASSAPQEPSVEGTTPETAPSAAEATPSPTSAAESEKQTR